MSRFALADDGHHMFEPHKILIRGRTTVSLAPIARRYAFPSSESATERVRVFKTKQIGGFVQLQDGIGEVIPRHLVPGFIQDALEAPAKQELSIEMEAFYGSVEQRDNPELRGEPVVVAWKGERSVVCAVSYEAKSLRRTLAHGRDLCRAALHGGRLCSGGSPRRPGRPRVGSQGLRAPSYWPPPHSGSRDNRANQE
jgi:hypothetical protein